jgi:hypothetical protein
VTSGVPSSHRPEPTGSPGGGSRRIRRTREPHHGPQAHLVLGHDRRPSSEGALPVAADLARRPRANLHVVHGIDLPDYPIDPDAADREDQVHRVLDAQQQRVADALADDDTGWSYHA